MNEKKTQVQSRRSARSDAENSTRVNVSANGHIETSKWTLREQAARRDVMEAIPHSSDEELVRWKRHIEHNINQSSDISAELIGLIVAEQKARRDARNE